MKAGIAGGRTIYLLVKDPWSSPKIISEDRYNRHSPVGTFDPRGLEILPDSFSTVREAVRVLKNEYFKHREPLGKTWYKEIKCLVESFYKNYKTKLNKEEISSADNLRELAIRSSIKSLFSQDRPRDIESFLNCEAEKRLREIRKTFSQEEKKDFDEMLEKVKRLCWG